MCVLKIYTEDGRNQLKICLRSQICVNYNSIYQVLLNLHSSLVLEIHFYRPFSLWPVTAESSRDLGTRVSGRI